jgi:hypothetical protein
MIVQFQHCLAGSACLIGSSVDGGAGARVTCSENSCNFVCLCLGGAFVDFKVDQVVLLVTIRQAFQFQVSTCLALSLVINP